MGRVERRKAGRMKFKDCRRRRTSLRPTAVNTRSSEITETIHEEAHTVDRDRLAGDAEPTAGKRKAVPRQGRAGRPLSQGAQTVTALQGRAGPVRRLPAFTHRRAEEAVIPD